ncbi:SRPBCC family protein [Candidatus Woesearchaeota archaeon]|nr:SRPBCC family protein [Candidatus Woesearchaeota archaeon]
MAENNYKITAEPGKQEITMIQEFDASPELVFKAYTDPELLVQWLGPRDLTMEIEKFDPKQGGVYRYVHRDNSGKEYAFHGVIHEATQPKRIVQTFEFEDAPGHVSLETATFEELPDGRTRVTSRIVFQSVEDRDSMIESGMERGVKDSYERLSELLERMTVKH